MQTAALIVVLFVCALVQVTSGFGFAVLTMPLVTLLLGIGQAAPLVAVAGLLVNVANTIRLHQHVNWGELTRLGLAAMVGVPLGFWLQDHIPPGTVRSLLGIVVVAYAIYTLIQPQHLHLSGRGWAVPFGLIAGALGAAYNTPGPPVAVYGTIRRWPRDEFRSTVQTLFAVNGLIVVSGHVVLGHLDQQVGMLILLAVPALIAGNLAGVIADRYIDGRGFQIIVKCLILITGIALLI